MKYLLDTNVLIHLQKRKLAHDLPVGTYAYSVISEIELLSWPQMQPEHEWVWYGLLAPLHRLELDAAVRDAAIRLRRQYRLKLPDAIIAASALVNNAVLLTNDQQLRTVPGLRAEAVEVRGE